MRSIPAALTAAQKDPTGAPFVTATVRNNVEAVRRLDFANLNATVNAVGKHDIAVAADNSIARVRMDAGIVKYQRILEADAGTPANWDAWVDLVIAMGSQVAIAAKGARVFIAYTDAAGTGIRFRESTDSGATFSADAALSTAAAAVNDLAVAYKNAAGDLMVFWVTAGALLQGNKRTAAVFGGIVSHTATFATLNGIAATYAFDYELLVTGTEVTTTKPTVWATIHGDGSGAAVGVWTAPNPQAQAEVGLATFQSPSLDFLDAYRANFTELPGYTGGTTRTYRTWLHLLNAYHLGRFTWRTPLPLDHHVTQGLARAHSATYVYESGFELVQRAPYTLVSLDLSSNLLAFELREDTLDAHGWLEVRNTAEYAGPPDPVKIGAQVIIGAGYYTSSGNLTSLLQDFWVTAIEHRRHDGRSTLRLYVEGALRRLRRSIQREQIVHDGTIDDYRTVLSGILNRAGLALSVTGASSRSDTVLPRFTVLPTQDGHGALRQLLSFLPDRLIAKGSSSVAMVEPLPGESSDYNVGTTHPLYALRLRVEPRPAGEAHVNALTAAGAFLLGHDTAYPDAEYGTAPLERMRDLTSDTAAEALATATAHLRQRHLDKDNGMLTVPPICGLELLDVVDFTDPLINAASQTFRVMAITWKLDRPRQIYEQDIQLGPL